MHKNNVTHKAKFNAELLHANYLERFGININEDGRYMASDTTAAALAVAQYVQDIEQV
jgi:hypothetical protein